MMESEDDRLNRVDDADELDRLKLLARLRELGFHSSGRKVRTDKNQQHEYPPDRSPRSKNCKERSDKGKTHNMSKARDDIGGTHVMTKPTRSDANQTHNYENKSSDFYFSQFQKASLDIIFAFRISISRAPSKA